MTDQPLVSIVVPVYNTEKYLSDCLESLLAQTEKNIEILAVDDGSSDGSPAVLRRYAANCPQIRIFTQKNAGPGAARNTALKNARGKYVMFCDSDDMFKPSMCREMAQIMENENVDFAFCDTEEYKKKVQTSHIRKAGMIDISPNSFPEIAVGIPCFIFRNDILKKYGIDFPSTFYGEDFAFAVKYIFISRCFYALDKKLYVLRSRNDSLMRSLVVGGDNPRMLGNMDALADMYDFLVDCGLANICRGSYLRIVERLTVGSFAYMSESDKRKAFVRLRKILAPFREKLEDFRLLALAADGKEKAFFRRLGSYNMSGTVKIKIFGLTWFKVKNKAGGQIYYVAGIPLLKFVHDGKGCRRYVLGIRIS